MVHVCARFVPNLLIWEYVLNKYSNTMMNVFADLGLNHRVNVIVIVATNRPDDIDSTL
jgi:SpoVK/Ycf46/Vps4 family AAA+-type ATPase